VLTTFRRSLWSAEALLPLLLGELCSPSEFWKDLLKQASAIQSNSKLLHSKECYRIQKEGNNG